MRKHMSHRCWLPLALAATLMMAACSSGSARGNSSNGSRIKLGFVVHVLGNPFLQQIIDGAQAAARADNVDLQVTGPTDGNADAQMQMIQNLVASGVQGIATSVPNASMATQLNQIIEHGVPVVQFNLLVSSVKAPYIGERATQSGRILAQRVLSKLGSNPSGKVIVGNCFPGDPSLDQRANGVLQTLHASAPGLKVLGPFDVKVAANQNFAAWQALLSANPDAVALIGLCAPDITSLGQLQAKNPQHQFVSGGYDLTTQNLQQLQDGSAYVSLGQSPFVQGYLPVQMLVDAIRKHIDLSKGGFINAGTEIVTRDQVVEPHGLPSETFADVQANAQSPARMASYYKPLISTFFKDWQQELEPIADESK